MRAGQDPFFVSASLCLVSAVLARWGVVYVGQEMMGEEDGRFRVLLGERGWDLGGMGVGGFKGEGEGVGDKDKEKDVEVGKGAGVP